MQNLNYVKGDMAVPTTAGPLIIAHLCNDQGIWHGPFAKRISRRWPQAETAYSRWYRERRSNEFGLGAVQFVNVNRTHVSRIIRVANMIAQRGTLFHRGRARPICYQTIAWCLGALAQRARRIGASVHMPRIGINQSGAVWSEIASLIDCTLCARDISVFVYDLKREQNPLLTHSPMQGARRRFELLDGYGSIGR